MSRADALRVADYLQHVLEAIGNIQDYTAGMDLEAFMEDRKTRDAVIRNLEVIGEACNDGDEEPPGFCFPACISALELRLRDAQCIVTWLLYRGPRDRLADHSAGSTKSESANFRLSLKAMGFRAMCLAGQGADVLDRTSGLTKI